MLRLPRDIQRVRSLPRKRRSIRARS